MQAQSYERELFFAVHTGHVLHARRASMFAGQSLALASEAFKKTRESFFTDDVFKLSIARRIKASEELLEEEHYGILQEYYNGIEDLAVRAFAEAMLAIISDIDIFNRQVNDCLIWQAGLAYDCIAPHARLSCALSVLHLGVLSYSGLSFRATTFLLGRAAAKIDHFHVRMSEEGHRILHAPGSRVQDHMLLLSAACHLQKLGMVEALLKHPNIEPSLQSNSLTLQHNNGAMVFAAENLQYNNEALEFAAENGRPDMMRLLLKNVKFKTTASDYRAFARAVDYHHLEVLDVLLQDSRLKFDFLYLLQSAARSGFEDGVKSLLDMETLVIENKEELNTLVDKLILQTNLAQPSEALLHYKITSKHYGVPP
jgi:hypothetical protein